jgi:hypothetical protein
MTNSGRTALSPPDFWPDHCEVKDIDIACC